MFLFCRCQFFFSLSAVCCLCLFVVVIVVVVVSRRTGAHEERRQGRQRAGQRAIIVVPASAGVWRLGQPGYENSVYVWVWTGMVPSFPLQETLHTPTPSLYHFWEKQSYIPGVN